MYEEFNSYMQIYYRAPKHIFSNYLFEMIVNHNQLCYIENPPSVFFNYYGQFYVLFRGHTRLVIVSKIEAVYTYGGTWNNAVIFHITIDSKLFRLSMMFIHLVSITSRRLARSAMVTVQYER